MSHRFFTVHEFAEFSRTTKATLRHYDKIGLLSPVSRGKNNYRCYSRKQLTMMNVIRTIQELGMSLADIKNLENRRTPEFMEELFEQYITQIDEKIEKWLKTRKFLLSLQKTIHAVADIDEQAITVQALPAQAIVSGQLNDYSDGKTDYDALHSFYKEIGRKYRNLNFNYPIWGIYPPERIKRGDWKYPSRYYFYHSDGHDLRPAALYVVGYTRGGYGQADELYRRLLDYIDRHDYELSGNIYEEYPLNEISVADKNNYLIRVMMTVQKKVLK